MHDHRISAELCFCAASACLAEPTGECGIAHQITDGSGKECGVADRDQQSGLTVDDDFGCPGCCTGDHWFTKSHRLKHYVGQPLVRARQHDQVGGCEQLWHVVTLAQEPDPSVQLVRPGGFFKPVP